MNNNHTASLNQNHYTGRSLSSIRIVFFGGLVHFHFSCLHSLKNDF